MDIDLPELLDTTPPHTAQEVGLEDGGNGVEEGHTCLLFPDNSSENI